MLTSRSEFGKTFTTAMWLLGTLAAGQMFAVGWAIVTRPAITPPARIAEALPPAEEPNSPSLAAVTPGGPVPVIENFDPFAEALPPNSPLPTLPPLTNGGIGATTGPGAPTIVSSGPVTGPVATPPPASLNDSLLPGPNLEAPGEFEPLSTELSNAAIDSAAIQPISDPEVERMVISGGELRDAGNMQGSLNALRQAEAAMPEHPRVLSEIAATYSDMGLDQKAAIYWKKVRELSTGGAEAYQVLADRELSSNRAGGPAARSLLRLGRITVAPDQTALKGERVVVRVPVEADPGTRPTAADMAMLIYFYDRVDGTKVQASTADTSQDFVTAPYDWQENGTEVIEVAYHQPEFTPEQKRELGDRAYYGYIIELYYRDRLQDTAADPPDLSALDPSAPQPPGGEQPDGPDGSLFPVTPPESRE